MSRVQDCPFCDVIAGRVPGALAYDDGRFFVLMGRYQPTGPGYALVVPHAHVPDLHSLSAQDCGPMLQMVQRTSAAMQTAFGATGTTVSQNNGPPGQTVMHLHFHVVPRRPGDGYPRRADEAEPTAILVQQAATLAGALDVL